MEKISFIIPKTNNKISESKKKLVNSVEDKLENKLEDNLVLIEKPSEQNDNYNKLYRKINNNVYKFNTVIDNSVNNNQNIFILYNDACKKRKEGELQLALEIFKLCETSIKSFANINLEYEIYVNIALISSQINDSFENISYYYKKAIETCSERAEPYFYFGLYCNSNKKFNDSYELFTTGLTKSFEIANQKYDNVQFNAYGKYLLDELSVACYWLKKYEEGKKYLEQIIDDPEFSSMKGRLCANMDFFNQQLNNK